jgi:uncharacterized phage protein gp47/JayE
MAVLNDTGLDVDSLEEIRQGITDLVHATVGPTLNLGDTSALGQTIGAVASQLRQLEEALQAVYASLDPYQATGDALAARTRLVGVTRLAATRSRAWMTITLAAGTYAVGDLVVHVAGDPTARFSNTEEIITAGGTLTNVPFDAQETGPVRANANTLTVIASPVAGFSAPNNPEDADLGSPAETDASLRQRWEQQLARRGSGTVDAILADLLQVPGVTSARVYENDTPATVDGIPGHAFEVVILGGDDPDIAASIFASKPAGIQAFGSTVETVTDTQGVDHSIGFSRPVDVDVTVTVTIKYLSGQYIGTDALKLIIVDWADTNLAPGMDALNSKLVQIIMEQPGIIDAIVTFTIPAPVSGNVVVSPRQIARFDTSRINVVATPVLGAP